MQVLRDHSARAGFSGGPSSTRYAAGSAEVYDLPGTVDVGCSAFHSGPYLMNPCDVASTRQERCIGCRRSETRFFVEQSIWQGQMEGHRAAEPHVRQIMYTKRSDTRSLQR